MKRIFGKQFDSIYGEKARLEIKKSWNSPGEIWKRDRKKNRFQAMGVNLEPKGSWTPGCCLAFGIPVETLISKTPS